MVTMLAVQLALVGASWECLNCKLRDTKAGFLFSYSYCEDEVQDNRICVPDQWNLISPSSKCVTEWKAGWELDIFDDCKVNENIGRCQNFESFEGSSGQYLNVTKTLSDNEMCTIKVNATLNTARVIFDDSDNLGVLYPGYKMGQPITVDQGNIKYIRIYNGNDAGPTSFKLSFSSASQLVV